jgi:hypothetical protein
VIAGYREIDKSTGRNDQLELLPRISGSKLEDLKEKTDEKPLNQSDKLV